MTTETSSSVVLPWREASKARLEQALEDLLARMASRSESFRFELSKPIIDGEMVWLPVDALDPDAPEPDGPELNVPELNVPELNVPEPDVPEPDRHPPQAPEPNALDQLMIRFGLSPFERDLLLATVGHELDARFPELLGGPPTFARLSPRLPEAHWSALAPDGPLRRGRLIGFDRATQDSGLVRRTLRVEEAVLHELLGLPHLDEALRPFLDPLSPSVAERLSASQGSAVQTLVELWTSEADRPVAWFGEGAGSTETHAAALAVASAAGRHLGWGIFVLHAHRLPDDPARIEELIERWRRDAVLQDLALVVEFGEFEESSARQEPIRQWLERAAGPTAVISQDSPASLGQIHLGRTVVRIDLPSADPAETSALWREALGPMASSLNGAVDRLAEQFTLSPQAIQDVATEARLSGALAEDPAQVEQNLWRKARRRARGGLDRLAQRLEPMADWHDLILPEPQMQVLRSVVAHVRQRHRVYETWGFAGKSRRGLGISALFSGPTGTGKTFAAEVLARALDLDLYRIDLSAVVSKYIGETERNLSRLFDAAERSGAILLFDEADSLFGKRSEVRDSHDRYANLEVSYLLQRIEAYSGLAILTTNFEKSLDTAFSRRLRFVVPFPLPSAADRRRIWQTIFPDATPTESLDWDRLAQLTATGGVIRNIAVGAAFRAADDNRAVTMVDLASAARAEAAKGGRQVPTQELRGWTP